MLKGASRLATRLVRLTSSFVTWRNRLGGMGSQAPTASWRENVGCWRWQAVCFRPDP